MAAFVFLLCAVTSVFCAGLLLYSYYRRRLPLLFWSGLCFVGFALGNILLVFDQLIIPQVDLSLARVLPSLVGVYLLLWGLLWEST